jgi:hypothetical protein
VWRKLVFRWSGFDVDKEGLLVILMPQVRHRGNSIASLCRFDPRVHTGTIDLAIESPLYRLDGWRGVEAPNTPTPRRSLALSVPQRSASFGLAAASLFTTVFGRIYPSLCHNCVAAPCPLPDGQSGGRKQLPWRPRAGAFLFWNLRK